MEVTHVLAVSVSVINAYAKYKTSNNRQDVTVSRDKLHQSLSQSWQLLLPTGKMIGEK